MNEQQQYVIGVDGGGSKTHALLASTDGTACAERIGGPSNLQTVGVQKAAETIFQLIVECCEWEKCKPDAVQNVVVGLAGAGRTQDRTAFAEALNALGQSRSFPFKNIIVETDAHIALVAAIPGSSGIVVIGGTGSIAMYRTKDGRTLRAGGWGRVLGDEGSGYAIARDALAAVMRQYDGRGEQTALTERALQQFRVDAVEDLIPKIQYEGVDITSFAQKVLLVAAKNDAGANAILQKNADEIVKLVQTLFNQSPPRGKVAVVFMGGMLDNENEYSTIVKQKVAATLPQVLIMKPKFPAAFGAAIIGLNAFQ